MIEALVKQVIKLIKYFKHLTSFRIQQLLVILNWQNLRRWRRILLGKAPDQKTVCLSYGHDYVPKPNEPVCGGMAKFQRMQDIFPNSPICFNLLYMGSSNAPEDAAQLLWLARQKGAKFVWNQNGVAYPAWHGTGWEISNQPMAKLLHAADYVFYQSQFCKLSADKFLGKRSGKWEILYNAVDTKVFTPAKSDPDPQHLILLLGGTQCHYYRVESAIRTVAALSQQRPDVRLVVMGRLWWTDSPAEAARSMQQLVAELDVADQVVFSGPYSQKDAPTLFQQAHILLHTQYNDACPGLVIEAIACGLPVVYSHSGGVPELVGEAAGIGVPTPLDWEHEIPPDSTALAEAVLQVAERRKDYAEAARQRAVEKFDLRPWLQRHREVFEELLQ